MMQQTPGFSGKVVLITGAGGKVGRTIAEAFAREDAVVAANDINPLSLDETLERIAAGGGKAREYVFDVAKRMPVQALVNQVLEDWGRVDILVNCMAVKPEVPFLEMDEWDWHRTLDVNLGGAFFTMQQVGKAMRQQGSGIIVNVVGGAGSAQGTIRGQAAYQASQVGLVGLTLEAAGEFAAFNIRVHAACLGLRNLFPGLVNPALEHELEKFCKEGVEGLEKVVEVVFFLCSSSAADLTGQVIHMDNGEVV